MTILYQIKSGKAKTLAALLEAPALIKVYSKIPLPEKSMYQIMNGNSLQGGKKKLHEYHCSTIHACKTTIKSRLGGHDNQVCTLSYWTCCISTTLQLLWFHACTHGVQASHIALTDWPH